LYVLLVYTDFDFDYWLTDTANIIFMETRIYNKMCVGFGFWFSTFYSAYAL